MNMRSIGRGLGGRFMLLLALIGVLASGLTGYYAFSTSRELLVKAAEERLLTATRVLARQVVVLLEGGLRDVRLLAAHPQVRAALASPQGEAAPDAEQHVADLFAALLATRSEYYQIRLIAAAGHGLERVRLDRDGDGVLSVSGDDLQEKGHMPYVYEALHLPPGQLYLSTPVINHEEGAHAGLGRPSIHLSMPIHDTAGSALGLVVINIDVERSYRQLSVDLPPNLTFMLANQEGDYLIHPDPAKAFAFDRGQRARVQDDFPAAAALFAAGDGQVVTRAVLPGGEAVVAAFVRGGISAGTSRRFLLGLSQPVAEVLADSDTVGAATARIVAAFSILSVLLATLLAAAIIRPLNQMLASVQGFSSGRGRGPLPIARRDELGVLARSIDALQREVDAQMASLQEKQRELDHLAGHDSLTGLPNRRLFMDRLEHALAHARRSGLGVGLLFIDLDRFKEINDRFGHAAGDQVLRTTAARMAAVVRETDTLARLGGDEFVILIDAVPGPEIANLIATKLIAALAQPMAIGGESLAVGCSIGISHAPQDGTTADSMIAAADRAMYRAKGGDAGTSGVASAVAAADEPRAGNKP